MPLSSPVAGSACARTEFPTLIAARSFPVGARSFLTASIEGSPKAALASPQASKSASDADRASAVTRFPDMLIKVGTSRAEGDSLGDVGARSKPVRKGKKTDQGSKNANP